ncbi:MAG TPA: hypothetical protein PLB01_17965 [Thermoanaerobaculia bacterium]|nr:hypothetical protein [Thermoanaerobaculia bacterium]
MRNAAALLLSLSAAGAALAQQQQAPTPIPQSVVVPSLPDEKNKEGTVRPGATQQTDGGGWVQTNMGQIDPNAPKTGAGTPGTPPPAGSAPGPGIVAPAMPSPPESGPKGKAVVEAANITLRGVVKAYEKGVSVTITEANGKDRTVPLADKAFVYEGVAPGDKVVVRVPLQKPADGKHADRVEKQKAPKAAPASKFSQAQSPKS